MHMLSTLASCGHSMKELNALIVQPQCTRQLAAELGRLVRESARVTQDDLKFAEPKATIEEWLG